MKVLFIGDIHLKISNMAVAKTFLEWIYSVQLEFEPDIVINLGDTFDTHAVVRSELLGEFKKHIELATQHCEYIYVLGNHDYFKPNDNTYHALQVFSGHYKNLTVVDSIVDREDLGITFVPYQPKESKFPTKTLPICIAHQTFVGCDFGGYKPEYGIDPDKISADIIISGHIHKKQSFGKVFYPGTPYSQNLKDINQVKGVHIFDTETYKIDFIKSPLPSWQSISIDISDVKSTISLIKNSINEVDNWITIFNGPRKEIVSLFNSKEWKLLCSNARISTRTNYSDSSKVERVRIDTFTVTDIFEEYIDKIYIGGLDKNLIKTTMRQLFDNYDKNSV